MKLHALFSGLIVVASANADELSQVNLSAGYQTSQEVFEYAAGVSLVKNSLAMMNFQLSNCKENMIYYFVEPAENIFKKSTYQCTYLGPKNHMSYVHEYAEINVDIYYNKTYLLHHEGSSSVRYWTVY